MGDSLSYLDNLLTSDISLFSTRERKYIKVPRVREYSHCQTERPCIGLAPRKFELTNQDSAGGGGEILLPSR